MGRKDEDTMAKSGDLNTIVGKGSLLEGTLKVENSIRVDGRIKGDVTTTESLVIGKEGDIDGEIIAKNAIIGGRVRGKISATGKVVLEAKAMFQGEMKTARLVIDDGAVFDGRCSMQKDGKLPFEPKLTESPLKTDMKNLQMKKDSKS